MTKTSTNRSSPHLRRFTPVKYKKAPQAPRRFKSSYMFYSTIKHKEIRVELSEKGEGQKVSTTVVAKMVSKAWKALPEDEREKWEEMARQDKARYEMEKSMYSGPWKVPITKRLSKDPKAPKRPMSAFLFFSNSKRAVVKTKHKDAKNAEVSRILAQMWKNAAPEEKKPFVDEEFELRQLYKIAMTEWKRKEEEELKTKRDERENEAMQAVREGKLPIRYEDQHSRSSSIGSSTTDSSVSTSTQYSTKMANDTFAPSVANPYPPVSHISSINNSNSQQNYSFSSSEFTTPHHNQQQYPPPAATSSHYSPEHQHNPYGAACQSSSPLKNSPSSSGYDAYGRRYEGGSATPTAPAMGYDTYGQPHPYGYAHRAYYQQDYSQGTYPPTEHALWW